MIKLKDKIIGRGNCFIIAEAGVNHNGSLELAKKLIDAAKKAGADAVKFQTFTTEKLVTKNTKKAKYQGKGNQLDMLKRLELKKDDFIKLKTYCDEKGVIFLSTPHTEDTLEFLDKLMPCFKISSGDLTNLPFLEKVTKKGKPIILSTGMSTLKEVREAVDSIKTINNQLILLHCTTSYPCEKKDVNLRAMETLKKEFNLPVGYSDHTIGIDVSLMAAKLGAVIIEKHFTLDKNMKGPDHKASLNPQELKEMIKTTRKKKDVEIPREILGTEIKKPTEEETKIARLIRKSVVSAKDIPANTKLTRDMLIIKRPGTGLLPKLTLKIIGKTAKKDIVKDSLISLEDIQ